MVEVRPQIQRSCEAGSSRLANGKIFFIVFNYLLLQKILNSIKALLFREILLKGRGHLMY